MLRVGAARRPARSYSSRVVGRAVERVEPRVRVVDGAGRAVERGLERTSYLRVDEPPMLRTEPPIGRAVERGVTFRLVLPSDVRAELRPRGYVGVRVVVDDELRGFELRDVERPG